jgi:hypothetical protein
MKDCDYGSFCLAALMHRAEQPWAIAGTALGEAGADKPDGR